MPNITVNQLDLHYELLGQGDPLLLIIGLSFSLLDWGTDFPKRLSRHYQVILFDNRDAGQTSRTAQPYTLADMAEDAVGLLDALNIPAAHVFGISMGGMIAQQIALQHPHKLKKLILGCTMAGGACSYYGSPPDSLNDALNHNPLDLLFPPAFLQAHRDRLMDFFATTVPFHSTGEALGRQLTAMNRHDTCDRLHQITAPTLIVTGDADRTIPPENSAFLAKAIPQAELEIIPGAGHAFCFSHPDVTAALIADFLSR